MYCAVRSRQSFASRACFRQPPQEPLRGLRSLPGTKSVTRSCRQFGGLDRQQLADTREDMGARRRLQRLERGGGGPERVEFRQQTVARSGGGLLRRLGMPARDRL